MFRGATTLFILIRPVTLPISIASATASLTSLPTPATSGGRIFGIKNVGTKQIWIDGQLFLEGPPAVDSAALPTDFTRIWLGAEGGGPDAGVVNNMHGLIDDFAVFGTALTQAQVQQLASGTLPSALPASAKPLAYWDFNDVTVARPPVTIARAGGSVTLSWSNATGFRLVSSDTVKGTYTDVQGVTGNSYTINNPTGTKFYYLIK